MVDPARRGGDGPGPRPAAGVRRRRFLPRAGRYIRLRVHEEPTAASELEPVAQGPGGPAGSVGGQLVPRIFGHYVPSPLLLLIAVEATVVFGSVFVGLALPVIGIPAFRPAWGDAVPAAGIL